MILEDFTKEKQCTMQSVSFRNQTIAYVVYILLSIISINTYSQTADTCNLFKNIKFDKDGRKVLYMECTVLESMFSPDNVILEKIEKKGLLKSSNYPTAILFKVKGCEKNLAASVSKSKNDDGIYGKLVETQSPVVNVIAKIVVYRDFKIDNSYFFVIDELKFKK